MSDPFADRVKPVDTPDGADVTAGKDELMKEVGAMCSAQRCRAYIESDLELIRDHQSDTTAIV